MSESTSGISFFEKYLSVWVFLCIVAGVSIGIFIPAIPQTLSKFEYANVSIPIAILIWLMIYPMMMKVDFSTIGSHLRVPKGLTITLITNWLIKPFSMFAIALLFFKLIFSSLLTDAQASQYIAGAVLLGAAPCTAMVFVWSHLTKGNPSFTVLQVAVNDLVILVAFAPIVALLLGIGDISVPMDTLLLSVLLFVVIPLTLGAATRNLVIRKRGKEHFENNFLPRFNGVTTAGLLLTLIIIFSFQGSTIVENPGNIVLIAIPLIIQTGFIFAFAYLWAYLWRTSHEIAAPAALIGASNFFELAVAVAIAVFGLESGATLVAVVGVLVEVPVMLFLVKVANRTKKQFSLRAQ
ncbi:ACR3 family arsenite efflux transporter [Salinispira pacifica]|uniref:Arsenical-resistance protein ACR3 n=1 Tax=Salinispira pacifica TaxID=1307761 RepID=V5WNA5_9SPIO|nr:ACR3 family arsenite efflux transporter [Salinispira pacifica]AHC16704.1 Arsenical-resistance protein ACR3 [Salinispira pacifica]